MIFWFLGCVVIGFHGLIDSSARDATKGPQMTGIIIFSALLSTITTTGLYTLLTRHDGAPRHRKGQ